MALAHNLGFPRIGRDRELKKALEAYWQGKISAEDLQQVGRELRKEHWRMQQEAGIELLPVGDFAWYDQVLTHSLTFGVIPERFAPKDGVANFDTLFAMARGVAKENACCGGGQAQEMTKWFDTNYHYLVPEFTQNQIFKLSWSQFFTEIEEAQKLGHKVKPVIIGPLTYLWLGKTKDAEFNKLDLLEQLLPVYLEVLAKFAAQNIEWVQIDEPILVLDLPQEWQAAFSKVYQVLAQSPLKKLVATYFGGLEDNLNVAINLPVAGLHLDLVRDPSQFEPVLAQLDASKVLSLGVVNGRNVWRSDLAQTLKTLKQAEQKFGANLWVAPSCSLLHSPVDLEREDKLDAELKSWLSFAVQKCGEIATLAKELNQPGSQAAVVAQSTQIQAAKAQSKRIHKAEVKARVAAIKDADSKRNSPFSERIKLQSAKLNLPLYPTTTIGSFPQTSEIRSTRLAFKQGKISEQEYVAAMQQEIKNAVAFQERLGLDVLVHGEAERNDMVEYFAEQLEGYLFTRFGWVQSYGSRCVKPAVIYGDLSRPKAMTVDWITYAQNQTKKVMKGMLTGPVTMLMWTFNREDISRFEQAQQLALAIRDEVIDLEAAGIKVIQIDEAAFREGLPLRQKDWQAYLDWAAEVFRLTASGVADATQIHTHMCYSEFNDIIAAIAAMDADVITIETSRSNMELLDAFEQFAYPNDIGPGVYDIHSPRVPSVQEIVNLMQKAATRIAKERLWVNPDCGLKTRGWSETEQALTNMVTAAKELRSQA